jgi:hypothetical protein
MAATKPKGFPIVKEAESFPPGRGRRDEPLWVYSIHSVESVIKEAEEGEEWS